jgi:hypothetical protein
VNPQRLFPVALLMVAAVALADTAMDLHWVGRPYFALAYLLVVPGYAVAGHLRLNPFVAVLTVAIGLSIAIGTIAAQLMLWFNVWNPAAAQIVIALPSMALLAMQTLELDPRRSRPRQTVEA